MTTKRSASSMNNDEKLAQDFLTAMGVGPIVFEPNGKKVAPDFLASSSIAVEVTRLNENWVTENGIQGLENAQFSLLRCFTAFLHNFDSNIECAAHEPSWFVSFCFRRPIVKWSVLEPAIGDFLERFARGDRKTKSYRASGRFSISMTQGAKRHASFFRVGGFIDQDSGGFVISLLRSNVQLCLERKSYLLPLLSTYSERWLILVDHVSHGSWEPFEMKKSGWDRVILLSPDGLGRTYDPSRSVDQPHSR